MIISDFDRIINETSNLEKRRKLIILKKHIELLIKYIDEKKLKDSFKDDERVISQMSIIYSCLIPLIEEYHGIVNEEFRVIMNGFGSPIRKNINSFLEHMKDLIEVSLVGEQKIEEGNIFLGIEEKLDRANKSVREGNIEGLFSNLHTIIELLFKDKLGIALDMDGAKLGRVLGICMRNDVFTGKNNLLQQLNINVCEVDNKIKHSGYNPSPKEINDALLITTQAIRVLKNESPNLNEEILEEISRILVKNN